MKTTVILLLALFLGVTAQANVYTYSPSPSNLYDLSHGYAFTWGIDYQPMEAISSATLTIHNIRDYIVEDNDSLYIHLLDDPPVGTTDISDFYDGATDYFAGQGVLIDTWSDPAGGTATGVDLTYNFTASQLASLNSFALNNGVFGFGFDPDCHYYNDGIDFKVSTVPEPATMVLFGLGLVGVEIKRRWKK